MTYILDAKGGFKEAQDFWYLLSKCCRHNVRRYIAYGAYPFYQEGQARYYHKLTQAIEASRKSGESKIPEG